MEIDLIETGKIINTHGLRGEVKIEPWADSPEAFCRFERLYLNGAERRVERARVQKSFVIAKLSGIGSIDEAEAVKNATVFVPRCDIYLGEGGYLIGDLMGLDALDESGAKLGRVTDILTLPHGEVLEIRGEREILVPLRDEFVVKADIEGGFVTLRLIEGM